MRSSWEPVAASAYSTSSSSVASVAIRVMARTLQYDNRPRDNAERTNGKDCNARATRTCSWAVRRFTPAHVQPVGGGAALPGAGELLLVEVGEQFEVAAHACRQAAGERQQLFLQHIPF